MGRRPVEIESSGNVGSAIDSRTGRIRAVANRWLQNKRGGLRLLRWRFRGLRFCFRLANDRRNRLKFFAVAEIH